MDVNVLMVMLLNNKLEIFSRQGYWPKLIFR